MPRHITNINGHQGIAPGSISNTDVPVNRRYHGLQLFVKANAAGGAALTNPEDIIEWIRLSVNGVLIQDPKVSDLIGLAKVIDRDPADNEVPIYFSDPARATVTGEEATSWDLYGQTSFVVEIKWKAGIVAPSLVMKGIYDFSRNVGVSADGKSAALFLSVYKVRPLNYNIGAGVTPILDIPRDQPIQRIVFTHSDPAAVISALEVIRESEKIFEATREENKLLLADYELDAEAFGAGAFVYAPDYDQQVTSQLNGGKSLEFRVTSSHAGTLRALLIQRVPAFA